MTRILYRRGMTFLVLFLLFGVAQKNLAWGPEGHIFIHRVASQHLPSSLPAFTKSDLAWIEFLANEPDRWQEPILRAAQFPDHFIDLERVDFLKDFPPSRFEFIRALYAQRLKLLLNDRIREAEDLLPERVGFQPYIASEIYERLVVAFREYRMALAAQRSTAPAERNVIFYMGWLGHYIGDAANPLHTTIHYNGWVGKNPHGYTTDKNTHFKFESQFVHDNLTPADFEADVKAPQQIKNFFEEYLLYLRASHGEVIPLYELEKAGGFEGKGNEKSRQFVAARLAIGAQKLVDAWYSAWLQSAQPPSEAAR